MTNKDLKKRRMLSYFIRSTQNIIKEDGFPVLHFVRLHRVLAIMLLHFTIISKIWISWFYSHV